MPSANQHPEAIEQYLLKEVPSGRIIGPLPPRVGANIQISHLGVIPKGHTPNKWRLITDLSFPEGRSVNDGIDPEICSLRDTSVNKVARAAGSLGIGALIAKLDIQSAYRLVPVHPDDRHLLGFQWQGTRFVDGMLPFGLRSAPKIFNAVADALEWIARQRGLLELDHYLDDFVTIGPPGSSACGENLEIMQRTCADLGVPLAMEKLEGPTTCLTFLGIEKIRLLGPCVFPKLSLAAFARYFDSGQGVRSALDGT